MLSKTHRPLLAVTFVALSMLLTKPREEYEFATFSEMNRITGGVCYDLDERDCPPFVIETCSMTRCEPYELGQWVCPDPSPYSAISGKFLWCKNGKGTREPKLGSKTCGETFRCHAPCVPVPGAPEIMHCVQSESTAVTENTCGPDPDAEVCDETQYASRRTLPSSFVSIVRANGL